MSAPHLRVQREEWRDAWLAGEAGEAQAAMEEALEAPAAWDPAPAAWSVEADDDAIFGGGSGADGAHATRLAWKVRSRTLKWHRNVCSAVSSAQSTEHAVLTLRAPTTSGWQPLI